jgi:hypothetical protein
MVVLGGRYSRCTHPTVPLIFPALEYVSTSAFLATAIVVVAM